MNLSTKVISNDWKNNGYVQWEIGGLCIKMVSLREKCLLSIFIIELVARPIVIKEAKSLPKPFEGMERLICINSKIPVHELNSCKFSAVWWPSLPSGITSIIRTGELIILIWTIRLPTILLRMVWRPEAGNTDTYPLSARRPGATRISDFGHFVALVQADGQIVLDSHDWKQKQNV